VSFEDVVVAGPSGPLMVRKFPGRTASVLDTADPLVFVHPVNTGGAVWHQVAPAVRNTVDGIGPVLVPDLRGHGRSTMAGPFSVDDYAADVLAVLDHFNLERAHFVGASIGGPLGVLLAARVPRRILSIASFGGALELRMTDEQLAGIDVLLERGLDALFDELVPAAIGPRFRTEALVAAAIEIAHGNGRPPQVVREIIRYAFSTDVSEHARAVRVPSLVVNGSEDGAATPDAGARMARALSSEPVVLAGVGHLPMLEAPRTVISLLAIHLGSVRAMNQP
jgi:pimeloyl-ACP methyl ester carboxylesterase